MGRIASLALAATALLSASCGKDRAFTASELAAELGVELAVGSQLHSTREEVELHEADLDGHSATLAITADDAAGVAEFERCQGAPALLCFRAANAVLYFERDLPAASRARLETALIALAEG